MATKWTTRLTSSLTLMAALAASGCGDLVRQGRAPVQVVINSLQAAPGNTPDELGSTLLSDVVTLVERTVDGEEVRVPTIFNDMGSVTMSLILKDPGQPGVTTTPTDINSVTFTRYRVTYRRADGRNTPGLDIPFPFDSAVTFTVPASGQATASFQLVRHTAKEEAPLAALGANSAVISTLTEVAFFGRDQAGNEVTVSGTLGVDFGNFADPE